MNEETAVKESYKDLLGGMEGADPGSPHFEITKARLRVKTTQDLIGAVRDFQQSLIKLREVLKSK